MWAVCRPNVKIWDVLISQCVGGLKEHPSPWWWGIIRKQQRSRSSSEKSQGVGETHIRRTKRRSQPFFKEHYGGRSQKNRHPFPKKSEPVKTGKLASVTTNGGTLELRPEGAKGGHGYSVPLISNVRGRNEPAKDRLQGYDYVNCAIFPHRKKWTQDANSHARTFYTEKKPKKSVILSRTRHQEEESADGPEKKSSRRLASHVPLLPPLR